MDLFSSGLSSSSLLSAVGTNATATIASFGPVIELIVGIILAFIIIKYLVGIFKQSGTRSSSQYDLVSHHMSNMEMENEHIPSDAISLYDNDL